MKPSVFRIVVMDLIDFFILTSLTAFSTLIAYKTLPSMINIEISFYFPEQIIEMFFVNKKLFIWLLFFGFFITLTYFVLCAIFLKNTVGGYLTCLKWVDIETLEPIKLFHAPLMAIGAYAGVFMLLIGPLSSWWLDNKHQGFSQKLSRTVLMKK